jgi:hypothetical protein
MHYAVVGRISAEVPGGSHAVIGAQGFLRLYNGRLQLGSEIQVGQVPITMDLEKEFAGFGEHYLGREPLDHEGGFEIGIDDRQHPYAGGPIRAVLELPFVKPNAIKTDKHTTQFVVLELFVPTWRVRGRAAFSSWNYQLGGPISKWFDPYFLLQSQVSN